MEHQHAKARPKTVPKIKAHAAGAATAGGELLLAGNGGQRRVAEHRGLLGAGPHAAQLAAQAQSLDRRASQSLDRRASASAPPRTRSNLHGLPDPLKAGVELLSGLAMDDVRVHYGSAAPARLRALAFAQGSDIHLGPGQERHLGHEAWHVVQQKQGRVRPTVQAKGVAINADDALEREADAMGAIAARHRGESSAPQDLAARSPSARTVQRVNGGGAVPAAGAAPAVPAAPAAPSREAAEQRMAYGNPSNDGVRPWRSDNYPPVNAKLLLTFANTGWGQLEVHIHWGPQTRWWLAAPMPTFKQGMASLGHLNENGLFKTWAVGQIDAAVPAVAMMDLLRRRNVSQVTVALGQALEAQAILGGASRIRARSDLSTLLYDDAWLPRAYWDAGAYDAVSHAYAAQVPAPNPPAAAIAPLPAAAAAAGSAAAATTASAAATTTNHASNPSPAAAASK